MRNEAIIYVDLQNDFFEGGALGVPGSLELIPVINEIHSIAQRNKWLEIYSRDCHPESTSHFDKWPRHCVDGTKGAELHNSLFVKNAVYARECLKGLSQNDDGYSAFEGIVLNPGLDMLLNKFLELHNINHLWVCGLATDYCVKATVLDARKNWLTVNVILDGIAAVNLKPRDGDKAIIEMINSGARILTLNQTR